MMWIVPIVTTNTAKPVSPYNSTIDLRRKMLSKLAKKKLKDTASIYRNYLIIVPY